MGKDEDDKKDGGGNKDETCGGFHVNYLCSSLWVVLIV